MEKIEVIVRKWKDALFLNGEFRDVREVSMQVPGFRKFVNDSLMMEASGKNIEWLVEQEKITWDETAVKIRDDFIARRKAEAEILLMKDAAIQDGAYNFKFKTKPMDHQIKAFLLSRGKEYYGWLMEMGTGKTKVAIDDGADNYSSNVIDCMLIHAPNGVHVQWINEQIRDHMPDWVDVVPAIFKASSKQHMKELDRILRDKPQGLKVIAFNTESLQHKKGTEYVRKVLETFRCAWYLDESVRFKTPGSLRTKNLLKLAHLAILRRIMSGAPITKGYEDLYAQLKFLHPDILGFSSFYTFRNYHCIMGGFEQRQIVGYRSNAIKELERKIEAYSYRITKQECLSLPEKVYTTRLVEMTDEQKRIYDELEDELDVVVGDATFSVPLAITKLLRMQQVLCGHCTVDADGTIVDLDSNRISTLMDCIEEAAGKVIVWSRFTRDIEKIIKELKAKKIGFVTYYGAVGGQQREDNINEFRNSPECKVFLAVPAAGGTGLNLAVADTVIYYSNDFNADTRWQSEDRAHRIGQKFNVTYIDLIAVGTIDEKIVTALRNKKSLADALLDDPRRFLS